MTDDKQVSPIGALSDPMPSAPPRSQWLAVWEQFKSVCFPKEPTRDEEFKKTAMGPVGIMLSGGYLYNHLASPSGDAAVYNEEKSLDNCNGHADPSKRYHYHSVPKCIDGAQDMEKSVLLGYLFDGFPVHGFSTCGNRQCISCYKLKGGESGSHEEHYYYDGQAKAAGECDLDDANGRYFGDEYRYVTTANYPFVMPGHYGTSWTNPVDDPTLPALNINECGASPPPPPPLPFPAFVQDAAE